MICPHELWMRLEPVDGVCPHCSFEENKRLRAALIELKTLGERGMGPDYEGWQSFHDKVAAVASAALSG